MEEEKSKDPGSFALFEGVRSVVPTFVSDVASYLTLKEQVTTFRVLSKDFSVAIAPFYPLVYEPVHPGLDLLVEANRTAYDNFILKPWNCAKGDEIIHDIRGPGTWAVNESFRLRCVEDAEDNCFFNIEARVRPDAACVDSFNLEAKSMEFHVDRFEDEEGEAIRYRGTIIGWAGGVHSAHSARDAYSPVLPGDAMQGDRWTVHAVVDLGKWSILDYLSLELPENATMSQITHTDDSEVLMEDCRFYGNEKFYVGLQRFADQEIREGVVYIDGALNATQRSRLAQAVERLRKAQQEPDYHPMSDDKVRDLVHPSLFSYVDGESPFFGSLDLSNPEEAPKILDRQATRRVAPRDNAVAPNATVDMWGRPYEDSKYQWLPTYFAVSVAGNVTIEGSINGINRAANPELYSELAKLFERFLPLLEHAWTYGRCVRYVGQFSPDTAFPIEIRAGGDTPPWADSVWMEHDWDSSSSVLETLRGVRLQVITKIVDYELKPGQQYEGVWHVEGMSHENIVATALYVADRDPAIEGGVLRFKRAFNIQEAAELSEFGQERYPFVDHFIEEGTLPLGHLETLENRMLVFPNSHVHKLSRMINTGNEPARRRIIVFFLVNPNIRIVSTQEVPEQRGTMSLERAKEHRLEMMKERRLHKQDWNVRELNLCEH